MTKTALGLILEKIICNFGTISEHISQLFQASFSSTQKCKKIKRQLLSRRGYPGRITEEGGAPGSTQEAPRKLPGGTQEAPRRHPPEVFPPSPGDVWDSILYKTLHKYTFGYQLLYIFYSKKGRGFKKGSLGRSWGTSNSKHQKTTKRSLLEHPKITTKIIKKS